MVGRTLTPPLAERYQEAFNIRQSHFPDEISFFVPTGLKSYSTTEFQPSHPYAFMSISLTGSACSLNCDHCNKKILEPMIPLDKKAGLFNMCRQLAAKGTETVLISGGSTPTGEVPFMKHIDEIKRVREELGLRIIMHTGLVTQASMAKALKDAGVSGVAIDIIGSNDTIREVYHLNASTEDYELSLKVLSDHGLSLRPHVILGLHFGQFLGEYHALEMISRYPVHSLVVVILVPMHGTNMWGVEPPAPSEVEEFFLRARRALPKTWLMLGCARPLGAYKKTVDRYAVDAGFNGIAFPAEHLAAYAGTKGLKVMYVENACSCGT